MVSQKSEEFYKSHESNNEKPLNKKPRKIYEPQ
jgi:hypothetical protein